MSPTHWIGLIGLFSVFALIATVYLSFCRLISLQVEVYILSVYIYVWDPFPVAGESNTVGGCGLFLDSERLFKRKGVGLYTDITFLGHLYDFCVFVCFVVSLDVGYETVLVQLPLSGNA